MFTYNICLMLPPENASTLYERHIDVWPHGAIKSCAYRDKGLAFHQHIFSSFYVVRRWRDVLKSHRCLYNKNLSINLVNSCYFHAIGRLEIIWPNQSSIAMSILNIRLQ